MAKANALQKQLEDLIICLYNLGKELPNCLISLTQVVQPQIPSEMRVPLLGKIFSEVSPLIQKNSQHLQQLVMKPPDQETAFRLLLDLRQVQQLLNSISYLQLLHITNNMIPPGSPHQQFAFLARIQEIFQTWTNQMVSDHHSVLAETPLHLERQQLLQLEPHLPVETLHLVIELLKLPIEELLQFKMWIESLPQNQLVLMVNLLQMEPAVLIEIKRRITSSLISESDSENSSSSSPLSPTSCNNNKTTTNYVAYNQGTTRRSTLVVSDDSHETFNKGTSNIVDNITNNSSPNNNNNNGDDDTNYYPYHQPSGLSLEGPTLEIVTDPLLDHFSSNGTPNTTTTTNLGSHLSLAADDGTHYNEGANIECQEMFGSGSVPPSNQILLNTSPLASSSQVPLVSPDQFGFGALSQNQPIFQLRIAKQPPAKSVYQRILKPFPAVMLLVSGPGANDNFTNLFVEASLLRSDSEVELPLCLDGNRVIRVSTGAFASFKKLKILSTSQQQGTLFRLKFQLKQYIGNVFETLPIAYTVSNPVEVFSHTQYLSERKNSPPPPNVTEILPQHGSTTGNTRVAILGSNFHNSPNLRVRFGDAIVTATFHESGTLICSTPPCRDGQKHVKVRVSNDGKDFCQTYASFTYS